MKAGLNGSSLRFAVIQLGARLHYAVPAVLAQAGMLQSLYTDAHAGIGGVRWLRPLGGLPGGRGVRRLLARHLPTSIPKSKVRSWLWPSLQIEWLNLCRPKNRKLARYWHARHAGGHWLARRAIEDNFGGANALYVHPCVSTDAVREAKRRGMFVVLEAISHPFNKFVERAEYERFGLTGPEPESELSDNLAFFQAEAELADIILAASPYVKEGLVELGLNAEKIAVVPYGIETNFFHEPARPVHGRVLYVGNIGYLKGIPHLAAAARALHAEGFRGEVRAVGPRDGRLMERPEFVGLNYLGQVPRSEIKKEFLQADVFVFPTLSDGFGIVLLEALAAGLPVICTPNCAGIVRDGVDGFVVPVRNATALAARMRELVEDRALHDRMAHSARARSRDFTLDAYAARLQQVLARLR